MSNFFYKLGKKAGPKFRRAKWIYQSLTGSEEDVIRIERQVGLDLIKEFRRQVDVDKDDETLELLEEIKRNLTACLKNNLRSYEFASLVNTNPNAFALPGGYIFISRSLMELSRWHKNEIASALAHEMGHVVYKHSINRILTNSAISIGLGSLKFRGMFANWLKNVGVKSLESAYSRDNELEADRFAVRLCSAAGYDPKGSIELFSRLREITSKKEGDVLGRYFSTHPAFEVRMENVRKAISALR